MNACDRVKHGTGLLLNTECYFIMFKSSSQQQQLQCIFTLCATVCNGSSMYHAHHISVATAVLVIPLYTL